MSCGPGWVVLGAAVGATGAIVAQMVAARLTKNRELERLKLVSFENFRREFTSDAELQRIDNKKDPLSDEEIDYYLGFFEEIGIYAERELVDVDLIDEIMGDSIILAYEDAHIRQSFYGSRAGTRDNTYFEHFERFAQELIRRKNERLR